MFSFLYYYFSFLFNYGFVICDGFCQLQCILGLPLRFPCTLESIIIKLPAGTAYVAYNTTSIGSSLGLITELLSPFFPITKKHQESAGSGGNGGRHGQHIKQHNIINKSCLLVSIEMQKNGKKNSLHQGMWKLSVNRLGVFL